MPGWPGGRGPMPGSSVPSTRLRSPRRLWRQWSGETRRRSHENQGDVLPVWPGVPRRASRREPRALPVVRQSLQQGLHRRARQRASGGGGSRRGVPGGSRADRRHGASHGARRGKRSGAAARRTPCRSAATSPGLDLSRIRVGTSSWTDKTLLASGWYPDDAKKPEARLRHYASQFDVVEVDSTYYSLPRERNAVLWIERTPKDFVFNVKAFSLMTQHPTSVRGLPRDVRGLLPGDAPQRLYPKDIPSKVADLTWEMFRSALMPLHSAGKLGVVMFQFPQWFMPNRESREYVLACRERLADYDIAVEFRQATWFADEDATRRTLDFLGGEEIPFVCVDMPQGFASSIPPLAEATSKRLALMRFHGRRSEV